MKKLQVVTLCLLLPIVFSCSQIKKAVSSATGKSAEINLPNAFVPEEIKYSSPDAHFGEEKAIVVTVLAGKEYYIGADQYSSETLSYELTKRLEKNPSERQLVYLNSEIPTEYGEIANTLDVFRKNKIENVGLRVAPKDKTETEFYTLRVKIPAEPKDSDKIEKPNPLTLIISLSKGGKIRLNNEEFTQVELETKLPQIFKERESNGVFREGTNLVEKTISVKAPRSGKYGDVVKLVDTATGAGASPIYLQIDDLEK